MEDKDSPRSFAVFLRQLADGEAERDLANAQHELIAKCRQEAESINGEVKGTLTLQLTYAVDVRDQITVSYKITGKEPPALRPKAVAWLNKAGHITFENPRQQKLPLREVPREKPQRVVDSLVEDGDRP
ncbi:MAG: hypothetical protein ACOY0T_37330 [Myxococcota bacterium]